MKLETIKKAYEYTYVEKQIQNLCTKYFGCEKHYTKMWRWSGYFQVVSEKEMQAKHWLPGSLDWLNKVRAKRELWENYWEKIAEKGGIV